MSCYDGGTPSEYWDYDYPDMSETRHPAHPDYMKGGHVPTPPAHADRPGLYAIHPGEAAGALVAAETPPPLAPAQTSPRLLPAVPTPALSVPITDDAA